VQQPTIRSYRQGDDPHAAKVIRDAFEEYGFTWEEGGYNADTEDIQSHYIDKGGWFWVMELDGEIIATAGLMPETEDTCELWRMYLQSEHRGKGYGRLLLQHILDFAKSQGFTKMDIWSDVKLIDAHRLYRKAGAEFIGQRICDDPDKSLENGYIMPL
jgi:putative acetyltransferase